MKIENEEYKHQLFIRYKILLWRNKFYDAENNLTGAAELDVIRKRQS